MTTYTQQNHAVSLARSSSFFGTIKNIVTAPFTWFAGSEDEFEDTRGKRRRLAVVPEDAHMEDETLPSRAKRMRVDTPDRDSQPYLDPPRSAFAQPRRPLDHSMSSISRDVARSPRKALNIPQRLPHARRTVSPFPTGSHLKPQAMTRTMSLDPPSNSSFSSRLRLASTATDAKSEPNLEGHSAPASRDVSASPRHLRIRSSLTPQPSGSAFGPVVPPRQERGPEEPPPLAALMSNPTFVKPPPAAMQAQGPAEPQKQMTLGTLLDSQRNTRPLARQSSILFGTGSMTDVSAGHPWPVNKAEVALHELEVYKTPLLPTRLKGAAAVPDMFLHKEKKHITLMTDDRPTKPRLGTKSKGKEKARQKDRESTYGTKPYAGEGGMKKWLARRKKEEQEAREKERSDAMEDEKAEEEKKRKELEAEEKKREQELNVPPVPVFEPRVPREGPVTSSLRVGRMRTGRNHIERPMSRRAKFSAAFEDEDEDMEESRSAEQKALEEAAKKVPVFEIPTGFTFAKETTIAHDLTRAKEPPITSLPFSLTKSTSTPPAAETVKAAPVVVPPAPAPVQPKIMLIPPTPETAKTASETPAFPVTIAPASSASATANAIPNFFANTSVFAKPAIITTPSSSSLTVPAMEQSKPVDLPKLDVPKPADAALALFGTLPQPIPIVATSSDSSAPKEAEKPVTSAPTLSSPFTFGTPAKPAEPVPAPTPSPPSKQPPVAESAQPVAPPKGVPFAFGAPALVAIAAPPPTAAATSVSTAPITEPNTTVEAPKSVFTFGQPASAAPAPAPTTAALTADTPKSLFGASPAAPFSFGRRPSTAPVEEKAVANPFSFEPSSTVEKKPTSSFTFGTTTTSTAAPSATTTFSFGATPSGTTAADVSSKPFSFGPAAPPPRPVTPPKTLQEVTMDESPARDMTLSSSGNGKAPERPTLNFSFNTPSGSALFAQSPATTTAPFSFGASGATVNPFAKEEKKETKPVVSFGGFGQTPSTGFSFGQKPPESPAATTPAPAPFSFGQPSPNVAPASPFSFGAPSTSAAPFGQTSAVSAPSSPSTFNRPASFTFGTPATTQPVASPFGFGTGSQPASPAAGSTALPTGTAGSAPFTFGAAANAAATSSGFGVSASSAGGGGSLFTMGSAPPPAEGAGRRIKGLPRRGARR